MKATPGERVRTTIDVTSGPRRLLAAGSTGTVIMVQEDPHEAYLVDLDLDHDHDHDHDHEDATGFADLSVTARPTAPLPGARPADYAVLYPGEFELVPYNGSH